jgi:hypothetical protein
MIDPPKALGPGANCWARQEASKESARMKSVRERYMVKIAKNPKWRETTKPGRGVVIAGAKLSS